MARSSSSLGKNATTLLLVRHGKTPSTGTILPGRTEGLHLSEEGQRQAEAMAKRITSAVQNVTAVYSSPLERCRETAAPLARELDLEVVLHEGLLECDFGDWTGQELEKLAKLPAWQTVQRAPSQFRFPNGESFLEMQARVTDAVNELAARHTGETVVAVSHADPIKVLLNTALGSPLDMLQRINISPCSVSALLFDEMAYGASPTVLTVNAVDDLGTLRPS